MSQKNEIKTRAIKKYKFTKLQRNKEENLKTLRKVS